MNARILDWIWHIEGSLALAPGQSGDEAFDRLRPLFDQPGTSHEQRGSILTFRKKDQAAQDRMSVFDDGTLRVEPGAAGAVLHYRLTSRALLFCFLAPLLFLAFGQLTLALGKFDKPPTETAKKAHDTLSDVPMHPIDTFLGSPEPEKKGKDKSKEKEKNKRSATPAYVFAAIFAALYLFGRIVEDRLFRNLLRKNLAGAPSVCSRVPGAVRS